LAEALLSRRLARLGIDATVSSAGLITEDAPVTPDALESAAALGLDTSAHRSRRMTREMVERADLVIGMAREHVREVLVLVPSAWPKTFTLKELVRRGEQTGALTPGQPLDEWLAQVGTGRNRQDLLGQSRDDDVIDPIGRDKATYERVGAQLDDLVTRLVALVWGAGAPG
jgi:protein-tyrosine phosphatase